MTAELDVLRRETVELWQPRTDVPISNTDADEMIANVSEFAAILAEWDSEAKAREAVRMKTRRKMRRLARLPRATKSVKLAQSIASDGMR